MKCEFRCSFLGNNEGNTDDYFNSSEFVNLVTFLIDKTKILFIRYQTIFSFRYYRKYQDK